MTDKMDRGLDEIIAENRSNDSRNRRGGGRRRGGDRQDYPRDGSFRNESRSIDREWVHDRFEENNSRRAPAPRRRRDESPEQESYGTKIRVENIHYDLTEEDLEELFWRIGKVTKLQLRYDRAGRSEGVAFVTYERKADATEAIRQFDGANANGQPIRLTLMQSAPSRNPFDTAVMPGKPLSERVSTAGGRSRSLSPHRRYGREDAGRKGIDRYIPDDNGNRSRSPMPRQRGGRRPGARREGAGNGNGRDRDGNRGEGRSNPRSKKTQEELDAEMEDYFGGNSAAGSAPADNTNAAAPVASAAAATTVAADDMDMIE